jgi:alkylation response protein AidB-like acyl-CoA dehydrogenase
LRSSQPCAASASTPPKVRSGATPKAAIRTRAEPCGDGSYRICGQKIFISYGEHDLTDNIVHLVLARRGRRRSTTSTMASTFSASIQRLAMANVIGRLRGQ